MYKRILVPTDASQASRRALITALELARQFNSEIELFHVTYTPEAYLGYTISYGLTISQDQLDQIGEATLEAALTGIDAGGIVLKKKHIAGHPVHAILDEIKRDIDLVVMGSRGHNPIAGAVIGSVTQRVLAHATCPVLIVK